MKAYVYIDGFNIYYRALRRSPYKWLNVQALATELLDESDDIEVIRYITADVSPRAGDPGAPSRQQAYMRALRTIPNLKVHKGRFLPKKKTRPLVGQEETYVRIHDTEEKGSDVNLAAHLINDAFRERFEVALVLSQDCRFQNYLSGFCPNYRSDTIKCRKALSACTSTQPGSAHALTESDPLVPIESHTDTDS